MTVNGVIFQRRADGLWAWREGREYQGVDGDDWSEPIIAFIVDIGKFQKTGEEPSEL